jgi:DNA modification methylase
MGSGTTAVEANLFGAQPYGLEIDPFARLISNVRVLKYDQDSILRLKKLSDILTETWKDFDVDKAFSPKLRNIEYWFSEDNFLDLLKFKKAIYSITPESSMERDFFRLILADMIRPCSKAERQTLKPYISTKYIKVPSTIDEAYRKSWAAHYNSIIEYSQQVKEQSRSIIWLGNNATDFTSKDLLDCAITSPPYINALDYVRCRKLESSWVDCGNDKLFSDIKKDHIGDSRQVSNEIQENILKFLNNYIEQIEKVDKPRSNVVVNYFQDMYKNLFCVYNALRSGGEYHIIIGDSQIRNIFIPTHSILAEIALFVGFEWVNYYWYDIKDHRTSIPRNGNGGKINSEHVISLRK